MSRRVAAIAATFGTALLSAGSAALAHPGHGRIPADQPAHYVLEPLHAIPLLAIAATITGVVLYVRRARQR